MGEVFIAGDEKVSPAYPVAPLAVHSVVHHCLPRCTPGREKTLESFV